MEGRRYFNHNPLWRDVICFRVRGKCSEDNLKSGNYGISGKFFEKIRADLIGAT
jgi:hypothetical protein